MRIKKKLRIKKRFSKYQATKKVSKSLCKMLKNSRKNLQRCFFIHLSRNDWFDRFDGASRWRWAVQCRWIIGNHKNHKTDWSWTSGQVRSGRRGRRPRNSRIVYFCTGDYNRRWHQRLTTSVWITTHPPLHRWKLAGNVYFSSCSIEISYHLLLL